MHWFAATLVRSSAVIGVAILALPFACWRDFSVLLRLSIANLAVVFFHFAEEFGVPGGLGEPAIAIPTVPAYRISYHSWEVPLTC